jgi:hypothetical protein
VTSEPTFSPWPAPRLAREARPPGGLRYLGSAVLILLAAEGLFAAYAWAAGSAHRLNSAHSRLGIFAADSDHVGVRYFACLGETVDSLRLTVAVDGLFEVVW